MSNISFDTLKNKVLKSVTVDKDEIVFEDVDGNKYKLYHEWDCCERVYIKDIDGDINDLIGSPLLLVEVVSSFEEGEYDDKYENESGNQIYTFYKLGTVKGYVTISFVGHDNAYYSTAVSFIQL